MRIDQREDSQPTVDILGEKMTPPAEKTTWQMGERERLRRAKKKNQRIIAAVIGFLAIAIIVLTICLTHKLYRDTHPKDGDNPSDFSIIQTEEEEDTDVFPGLYRPYELEYPEPYEEEDNPFNETDFFNRNNSYEDYSNTEGTVPIAPDISGSNTTTPGSNTTNYFANGNNTSSNTSGGNSTSSSGSSGSTTNRQPTTTTTVKRLESVTLYCSVTKATKGSTATLSYKAVNNQGTDVTNQCVVSFTAENCTVSNKTVTFNNVGTAKITAKITYRLTAKTTNTVTVTVTEADTSTLASAALTCSNANPVVGQTGDLALKVVDNNGADITSKCTVTYNVGNCTLNGSTVTFDKEGSATITAAVTYNGVTKNSNTITLNVTKAAPTVQKVTLTCTPADNVKQGDTGTLSAQVTDSNGGDITGQCTLAYEGTGCTVSGSTVTFDTVGTATLKVTATYNGQTVASDPVSITVGEKLELKSCQLVVSETTVEKGTEMTLSVVATDTNGNQISDVDVQYSGENCTVTGDKVVFDQAGTAKLSATVTYNGTASVADPVTVYVQVNKTLEDGTKINLADVSQKVEDDTFGYSLGLPEYFESQKSETDGQKIYTYEKLGMTVTLTGANRTEEDTATVSQLYRDRMLALEEDEEVELSDSSVDRDKGCYTLRWEKDGMITEETVYVGEKSTNTLVITYKASEKEICGELAEYTSATFQAGDLTISHEAPKPEE